MLTRKRIGTWIVLMIFTTIFGLFTACGQKEEIKSTSIEIDKKGEITATIIEDFDKSYYSLEGLEDMIMEEIIRYQALNPDTVSLTSVSTKESLPGKVIVIMKYANWEAYMNFNDVKFFYGSIEEAKDAGFSFNIQMISTADQTQVINMHEIEEMTNHTILIMEEPVNVIVPKKVEYFTEGCELITSKKLNVLSTDALNYIMMK